VRLVLEQKNQITRLGLSIGPITFALDPELASMRLALLNWHMERLHGFAALAKGSLHAAALHFYDFEPATKRLIQGDLHHMRELLSLR
jgi:hypothetical protein